MLFATVAGMTVVSSAPAALLRGVFVLFVDKECNSQVSGVRRECIDWLAGASPSEWIGHNQ